MVTSSISASFRGLIYGAFWYSYLVSFDRSIFEWAWFQLVQHVVRFACINIIETYCFLVLFFKLPMLVLKQRLILQIIIVDLTYISLKVALICVRKEAGKRLRKVRTCQKVVIICSDVRRYVLTLANY